MVGKKLNNGQVCNATHHRCTQVKCVFYLRGGCCVCDDCGSVPYEMNNVCDRCYACEHIADALRWGDRNLVALQEAKQRNKLVVLQ